MKDIKIVLEGLQERQCRHDRQFHRDIFCSSYVNRMRHLVFHFAKYVGRLAELSPEADYHLQRTLADTFIISLSAADLLNVRIAKSLVPDGYHGSIRDLSKHLADKQRLHIKDSSVVWFFRALAIDVGRMAKVCEAHDHLEAFDYQNILRQSVLSIVRSCFITAGATANNLESLVRARWKEVENKQIV
jgi:hypothetical protein